MRALIVFAGLLAGPALAQDLPSGEALRQEINALRAAPSDYAKRLRAERQRYDGVMFVPEGSPVTLVTREGVAAVDEAITALERQAPLPPLGWGAVLADAATGHARTMGERGARGHFGPDGSDPGERVRRAGGDIYVGEVIAYGPMTARDVVRTWIVDDGVANRGHRKLLLSAEWRFIGGGCAVHSIMRSICVMDVAHTPDGQPVMPAAR